MREFEILFSKGSADHVYTWKKDDQVVQIYKCWDWYGGTLKVNEGEDFDIEKVRQNDNQEWQSYEFVEGEDFYEYEYQVDSQNDSHEEILESEDFDEGFEALCEALEEEGYTLQKQELVVEKSSLAEIEEI